MCGIAGILALSEERSCLDVIYKMTDSIRHRGPDDEGYAFIAPKEKKWWLLGGKDTPDNVYASDLTYTPEIEHKRERQPAPSLVLGHRRLSIIDLSPAGHQPMCTADGRYWIIYNGEIYNYIELREDLIKAGYTFASMSDTEVLLKAYVHWGVKALNRLTGMFAFAIFDMESNQILLARDFFGIKPLYYTRWNEGFAFSSEIKALFTLPFLKHKINPQKAYDYLRFGHTDTGADTFFSNIHQLPAANYLFIDLDRKRRPTLTQYWKIASEEKRDVSFSEASKTIRELFLNNVTLHLRSDVPVGTALSGGIDSSSIVMGMRQVQGYDFELHSFSYIAEEPLLNEERWIDIITRSAKTKTHKVHPTPEELISNLDDLIYLQDEPFGSTSIYAQFRIMRMAKEKGIKVMLDGQGADEIFAGYRFYLPARLASLLAQFKWLGAIKFFSTLINKNNDLKLRDILMHTGSFFLPETLQSYIPNFPFMNIVPKWLNKRWFEKHEVKVGISKTNKSREILKEELKRSLMTYYLIGLLRYEDRNSMNFSIESRVPFLTTGLVNFVASLPEEYLIDNDGTNKSVFRSAMKNIVPAQILSRKDKIGFATPEHKWIKSYRFWFDSILNGDMAKSVSPLNISAVLNEWQEVLSGQKTFASHVWRWINFIRWAEKYDVAF